jgi:hypothetical protein
MERRDGSEYDALAAKINELSQVCARLSEENAELRDRVGRLTSADSLSPSRAAGPPEVREARDEKLSRRKLGKALGAAAAGVVGAAALVDVTARPAAASNGSSITAGSTTTAESATTVQYDGSGSPGVAFLANDTGFTAGAASFPAALGGWAGNKVANGIYGYTEASNGHAVVGVHASGSGTGSGVAGFSDSTAGEAFAVLGTIESGSPGGFSAGVRGINNGSEGLGIGVWGSQAGSGWGVYGTAAGGIGVLGNSSSGTGVEGSGATGVTGVGGTVGVLGEGVTGVQASGGTTGVSATGPTAVHATGGTTGVSATGPTGVHGSGSGTAGVGVKGGGSGSGGRGGIFSGAAAQVQLSPGSLGTHPKSGKRGDLYADNKGRLWFCKTGGNTAVWHQIA